MLIVPFFWSDRLVIHLIENFITTMVSSVAICEMSFVLIYS